MRAADSTSTPHSTGPAIGDRSQVERLVANLVDNALRHNIDQGRIDVITSMRPWSCCGAGRCRRGWRRGAGRQQPGPVPVRVDVESAALNLFPAAEVGRPAQRREVEQFLALKPGEPRGLVAPRSAAPAARWRRARARTCRRSDSIAASGSASATSTSVRSTVIGVRSSCEALATNRRWDSNARSSRPSSPSNVSASSFSSSSGPVEREALVQVALGDAARADAHRADRAQRPAGHQPAEPDRGQRHDPQRQARAGEQSVELAHCRCRASWAWTRQLLLRAAVSR